MARLCTCTTPESPEATVNPLLLQSLDFPAGPRFESLCAHQTANTMAASDRAADGRLAVYGTLTPGRVNERQLAPLRGRWRHGTVRGRLADAGWGAEQGYPGLILDPEEPAVEVHLFESPGLPDHWDRLDAFEGPGYRRVLTHVRPEGGDVDAWIYVLAAEVISPHEHHAGRP